MTNNRVRLVGTLGKDLVIKTDAQGKQYSVASILINKRVVKEDGESCWLAQWFAVYFTEGNLELLAKRFRFRDLISLTGSLDMRTVELDGEYISSVYIKAESISMVCRYK